jgi:uncharacterized membrane protein
MELLRRKLLRQIFTVSGLIIAILLMNVILIVFVPDSALGYSGDLHEGYRYGLLGGMIGALGGYALKYYRAFRDPAKLRELYIRQTDERRHEIGKNANMVTMKISMIGLGVASIVASYFSNVVFETLYLVLLALIVVNLLALVYYNKVN